MRPVGIAGSNHLWLLVVGATKKRDLLYQAHMPARQEGSFLPEEAPCCPSQEPPTRGLEVQLLLQFPKHAAKDWEEDFARAFETQQMCIPVRRLAPWPYLEGHLASESAHPSPLFASIRLQTHRAVQSAAHRRHIGARHSALAMQQQGMTDPEQVYSLWKIHHAPDERSTPVDKPKGERHAHLASLVQTCSVAEVAELSIEPRKTLQMRPFRRQQLTEVTLILVAICQARVVRNSSEPACACSLSKTRIRSACGDEGG